MAQHPDLRDGALLSSKPLVVAAVAFALLAIVVAPLVVHSARPVVSDLTLADPAPLAPPPSPALAADPSSEPLAESPRTTASPDPSLSLPEEWKIRRALEPKVWSGHASIDEIKMLKA